MYSYLRFSINGKFVVNFNQVASYTQAATRAFPKKRSIIISQNSITSQSSAALFPDSTQIEINPLANKVAQQCEHIGDCLEALHARTSRLVQTPPSTKTAQQRQHKDNYFRAGVGSGKITYDNEVLLEPIFTALPSMDNIVSIVIPFSIPITITSSLGLGIQNKWIPDDR